jgi:hypothetical protein
MEHTGSQLGPVRLHVDEFGLQACGQLFSDVPAPQAARALAGFPSYDARRVAGRWRLFGLHVVNTPGHTIYEEDGGDLRMVASVAPTIGPRGEAARAAAQGACSCGGRNRTSGVPHGGTDAHTACSCNLRATLSPEALADLATLDRAMSARRRARAGSR